MAESHTRIVGYSRPPTYDVIKAETFDQNQFKMR